MTLAGNVAHADGDEAAVKSAEEDVDALVRRVLGRPSGFLRDRNVEQLGGRSSSRTRTNGAGASITSDRLDHI